MGSWWEVFLFGYIFGWVFFSCEIIKILVKVRCDCIQFCFVGIIDVIVVFFYVVNEVLAICILVVEIVYVFFYEKIDFFICELFCNIFVLIVQGYVCEKFGWCGVYYRGSGQQFECVFLFFCLFKDIGDYIVVGI